MKKHILDVCMFQKIGLSAREDGLIFAGMIPFLIAGGSVLTTLVAPEPVDLTNHTLLGVKVKAKEVVARNMWGTPMMPDGKGSYSLVAPPDPVLIERSLIQPPKTDAPIYHPDKPYPLASQVKAVEEIPVPVVEPSIPVIESAPIEEVAPPEEPAAVEEPAAETASEPAPEP